LRADIPTVVGLLAASNLMWPELVAAAEVRSTHSRKRKSGDKVLNFDDLDPIRERSRATQI